MGLYLPFQYFLVNSRGLPVPVALRIHRCVLRLELNNKKIIIFVNFLHDSIEKILLLKVI